MFQSTHPYRVWLTSVISFCPLISFNPHTHTGCDWGFSDSRPIYLCFNPHTHTGCDLLIITVAESTFLFQSTHPYRVWHFDLAIVLPPIFVSIHTPIQGVTCRRHKVRPIPCFNPHTHTGCDQTSAASWCWSRMFQSTHPYRVWHNWSIRYCF